MKYYLLFLCILIFRVSTLCAIDITVDNYLLRIHEDGSHYSFFYRDGLESIPLFYAQNHRTSDVQLFFNNLVLDLNNYKEFSVSVNREENTIISRYEIEELLFELRYTFLTKQGEVVGLEIVYFLENKTQSPIQAGIRNIFDTELGEDSSSHFLIANDTNISSEYNFSPVGQENYLISSNGENGLIFFFGYESIDTEVILANWKRIIESAWEYNASRSLSFDFQPFSNNDSAAMVVFTPQMLEQGESIERRLILSYFSADESIASKIISFSGTEQYLLTEANINDDGQFLNIQIAEIYSDEEIARLLPFINEINTVNLLISEIDSLLSATTLVDRTKIQTLNELLNRIK